MKTGGSRSSSSGGKIAQSSVTGDELLFGNDFDRPIRDKLPPGFSTAFRIVKWFIDPGLEGDVDADEPYLYGPLLSSINTLETGGLRGVNEEAKAQGAPVKDPKDKDIESSVTNDEDARVLEEAGSYDNAVLREKKQMPSDSKKRMKYYLNAEKRKDFQFEKGREYRCDFYNPYLDFNGAYDDSIILVL